MSLLPELMGSWFSRPFAADSSKGHNAQPAEYSQCDVTDTEVHQQNDDQLDSTSDDLGDESQPLPTYCYCNRPEFGRMLACDNQDCAIEWFHIEHDSQRKVVLSRLQEESKILSRKQS